MRISDWSSDVCSSDLLQTLLAVPVHVAGMTALELAGYWHYAPLGRRRVWLYTEAPAVRSYLRRMALDAAIDMRSRQLFDDADLDLGLEARIPGLEDRKIVG